ncbi:MAG: amidohydrolase, partial [Actinobacteria bacterium]|nr:amidohydrolase [Actinomycetota bacterium]
MSQALDARVVSWRHDLHGNPETGFNELGTSDYVAAALSSLGVDVVRGVGGTGVVGSLTRGDGVKVIGLRADMDGLELKERGDLSYRSQNDGVMHACGHDGHMAMVLGAAARLADEGGFDGTVRFVFQPAEEHGRGAKAMLADGLLARFPMDAMFGLHNWPGIEAGHIHTRSGGIMASEDNFEIAVTGRGGHAARPHMLIDPIVIAAEIVLALQTIVARSVDPSKPAVVSCTEIVTDGVRNAVPGEVIIRGDTRSFDPAVQALLEERMRALCEGIAAAHGATCRVTYTHEFEPTVNDPAATAWAVRAAELAVGIERVVSDCDPVMPSEDFGAFLRAMPGCFAFIGNGTVPG